MIKHRLNGIAGHGIAGHGIAGHYASIFCPTAIILIGSTNYFDDRKTCTPVLSF
jgi:hypothetical protein